MEAETVMKAIKKGHAAREQAKPPEIAVGHRAGPLPHPPALDGSLGDPLWHTLPSLELLFDGDSATPAPAGIDTVVHAGYDGRGLYLGIRCHDDAPGGIKAGIRKDGSPDLWKDDSLEVYIAGPGEVHEFCQFVVNPLATRSERRISSEGLPIPSFEPGPWTAAAELDGNGWSAELFFPFEILNGAVSAVPGTIFRFAVRRFAHSGAGRSAVSAPGAGYGWSGYARCKTFGKMLLTGEGDESSDRWVREKFAGGIDTGRLLFENGRCLRRCGDAMEPVSWSEALEKAADGLGAYAESQAACRPGAAGVIEAQKRRAAAIAKASDVFEAACAMVELGAIHANLKGTITDSAALWREYAASPDTHCNIPNCSYAGYRAGAEELPEVPAASDVTDCGARGDGAADDTQAFRDAIRRAKEAGGGAVLVPAGRYRLTAPLRLDASGLVLRGEGSEKTVLFFERPLVDTVAGGGRRGGGTNWSYRGGNVWVGPEEDWEPAGADSEGRPRAVGEGWSGGTEKLPACDAVQRGGRQVRIASPQPPWLRPGETVLMSWTNPPDNSLLIFMAGHERMRDYPWESMKRTAGRRWLWPVGIERIDGDTVTLAQPLRVDVRPEWQVTFETLGPHVSESGVEGLTLEMPLHKRRSHCKDLGYNGLYFSRALNCWGRDIEVVNTDNGINLSSCKHVTVRDFTVSGAHQHHSTTTRTFSHDTLMTDFRVESEPFHGLNVEGMSSGNVWRRGLMLRGSFDYHRALSYENIRTDIEMSNEGKYGGNDSAGPRLGARSVHWNIRVTRKEVCTITMPGCGLQQQEPGQGIYQPDLISDGALVGFQGVDVCLREAREPWGFLAMAPGDKNCIVADHGRMPEPPDLYRAQLELRTGRR